MTSKYELTHDDSDVPTHYGWKIPSRLANIEKQFLLAQSGKPLPKPAPKKVSPENVKKLIQAARSPGAVGLESQWRTARRPAEVQAGRSLSLEPDIQPEPRNPGQFPDAARPVITSES